MNGRFYLLCCLSSYIFGGLFNVNITNMKRSGMHHSKLSCSHNAAPLQVLFPHPFKGVDVSRVHALRVKKTLDSLTSGNISLKNQHCQLLKTQQVQVTDKPVFWDQSCNLDSEPIQPGLRKQL